MPIYEYECGDCQNRFERKQRFDEEPIKVCPRCQGKARRVIHSVPIIFKGSGFYVTDHRKSGDAGKPSSPMNSAATAKQSTSEKGGDTGEPSTPVKSESKGE